MQAPAQQALTQRELGSVPPRGMRASTSADERGWATRRVAGACGAASPASWRRQSASVLRQSQLRIPLVGGSASWRQAGSCPWHSNLLAVAGGEPDDSANLTCMAAEADIVGADRVVLAVALVGECAGVVRLGAAAHDASDASVSVTSVATTDSDLPWALELVKAQCGVGSSSRQVTIIASRTARTDVLALLAAPLEADGGGGEPYHVICRPARACESAPRLVLLRATTCGCCAATGEGMHSCVLGLAALCCNHSFQRRQCVRPAVSEGTALRGLLDARILELEEGSSGSQSRAERSRLLAATIDTGDVAAMQALGGLLDYIGGSQSSSSKGKARPPASAALTLSCVREFSLAQTLAMDVATAVGLGVVDASGTGRAEPSSSLEGLLSRAGSATGKRILRQWLLRPSTDVELLNKRLDAVAEAKSAMRQSAGNVNALRKALRSNALDVVSLLRAISGARSRPTVWQQLHHSTQAMLHVSREQMRVALAWQLALHAMDGFAARLLSSRCRRWGGYALRWASS